MDKTSQSRTMNILFSLKEKLKVNFPKTAAAISKAPDDILSTAVNTGTQSLKTVIRSKVGVAVSAAAIAALAATAATTATADPPNTVPVASTASYISSPSPPHPNAGSLSAIPCLEIMTKEGGMKIYDKELAKEVILKVIASSPPHVQAIVKDVENGSIHVLIELTYVSQPADISLTTTTTSDDSLDWASIMEDFANSFAEAFYEEGCKQSLFDPINYEAECEIELNSEVAQTKMLMIKKGWSALLASCFLGYVEIVQLLLSDSSMNVNEADKKNGISAFHYACSRGHVEVVRLLLSGGRVAVNKASMGGWTALHFACSGDHVEVVKLLLAHIRVNVNAERGNGRTPLHEACSEGFAEVVKVLLSDGRVDVNKEDMFGRSPLHEACSGGNADVVKLLLSNARVDVNKEDWFGRSPMHFACSEGHADVVKLLLSNARVEVNKEDKRGRTPLDVAANQDIIDMLIEKGGKRGNAKQSVNRSNNNCRIC